MAKENINTWQKNINSLLVTIDILESSIKSLKKQVLKLNAPKDINNLMIESAQDIERAKNQIKFLIEQQENKKEDK